jgi:hypothetical protein
LIKTIALEIWLKSIDHYGVLSNPATEPNEKAAPRRAMTQSANAGAR